MKFKIYYINLDRSPDKRKFMEAQLASSGFSYERIAAVDGRYLDMKKLSDFSVPARVKEWENLLTPNAIACSLSHHKAYCAVVDDGVDVAMILEDDILFKPEFTEVINSSLASVNETDVILAYFHGAEKTFVEEDKVAIGKIHGIYQAQTAWGAYAAGGYLLHSKTALKLKNHVFPIHTTADSWGTFRRDGVIGKLCAILPPITTDAPFASDIGYGKLSKIKTLLLRGKYSPFRWLIIPFRRYIKKIPHDYVISDDKPASI